MVCRVFPQKTASKSHFLQQIKIFPGKSASANFLEHLTLYLSARNQKKLMNQFCKIPKNPIFGAVFGPNFQVGPTSFSDLPIFRKILFWVSSIPQLKISCRFYLSFYLTQNALPKFACLTGSRKIAPVLKNWELKARICFIFHYFEKVKCRHWQCLWKHQFAKLILRYF